MLEESALLDRLQRAKDAIRRYLETPLLTTVEKRAAWQRLAGYCHSTMDWLGEVHALVEISELPDGDIQSISNTANRFNSLVAQNQLRLDSEERMIITRRLLRVIDGRLAEADATDCSRFAWLHLRANDEEGARRLITHGLTLDPENEYCQNLAEKFKNGL